MNQFDRAWIEWIKESSLWQIGAIQAFIGLTIFLFMIYSIAQMDRTWNPCYDEPQSKECATWNEKDDPMGQAFDDLGGSNTDKQFKDLMGQCYSGIDLYGMCGMFVP